MTACTLLYCVINIADCHTEFNIKSFLIYDNNDISKKLAFS